MKRSLFCLAALWLAGGSSVSVTALELANASIADINAAFDSGELTSERLVELLSELASGDARSSLGGVTRNPYDPMRSPSGSSQGTAVAVAAGYVPLGLGTDTGGSIRLPTSANGIAGIRPTQGLLSRDGIIPLSSTFDMPGPMARTVEDVARRTRCSHRYRCRRPRDPGKRSQVRDRLYEVPRRRCTKWRAHRRGSSILWTGRRRRLGP